MPPRRFLEFGPDPPPEAVRRDHPEAAACLPPARDPPAACDAAVGSLESGAGLCADPAYARTTLCACVNNALPCPTAQSAACANAPSAYVPTRMRPGAREFELCARRPLCVSLLAVDGDHNLVEGTQVCGEVRTTELTLAANPALALLLFAALVAFAVAATTPGARKGAQR